MVYFIVSCVYMYESFSEILHLWENLYFRTLKHWPDCKYSILRLSKSSTEFIKQQ